MAQRAIVSPTGRPRTLAAVRPNAGLEARFRRALVRQIDAMHASLMYFLARQYRSNPPLMAQDSPASDMREAMRILARRWTSRFDKGAEELAAYFAQSISKRSDAQLRAILKKAGISVKFTMSKPMQDVMTATIGEQVGLIKSIAAQHLSEVEGLVMRSVQQGRNLKTLTDELQKRYHLTRERAVLIARDQNNKATAAMTRVRQQELGMTEAVWLHSHGGRVPRPTHLANSGKKYDIATGWYDPAIKKYIWPGTEVNCRCVSKSIVPGFS
jgi:SPP1 gp7 family putative phage head morphogenesis protein